MDELILPELNKTFFIDSAEFKVCFINEKRKRFAAEPHVETKMAPKTGDNFMIEGKTYKITYVHKTRKRITAKPHSIGY